MKERKMVFAKLLANCAMKSAINTTKEVSKEHVYQPKRPEQLEKMLKK